MFIHAGIAHIAFNLFALAYLGGYAERAIGAPRYVLIYFSSGIVAALSWRYSLLYFKQRKCSINRSIRSYFWCIWNSCCSRQYEGILLAGATNCICGNWFYKCTSDSIYCSCWRIYSRCAYDQSISKIGAVKKKIEIFSAAMSSNQ
jgi:hypothetical protein